VAILIALEGVLRDDKGVQLQGSLKLYRSLVDNYRVLISTDSSMLEAERWCRIHGIWDYAEMYDKSRQLAGKTVRASHLDIARAAGGHVELYIDSDADNCKHALSLGVPSFFYAAPKLVPRKEPIRAWQEIAEQVEAQKAMAVGLEPELERYE